MEVVSAAETLYSVKSDQPLVENEEEEGYLLFQLLMADDTERITLRLYNVEYMKHMQVAERRIALQMALRYFRDANQSLGSVVSSLGPSDIVLLEGEDETNFLHLLFVGNLLPHVNVSAAQFPYIQLSPSQILILSDECQLSQEALEKVADFVQRGGTALYYSFSVYFRPSSIF
jgi:hypothetical protein